ncbi:MAG: NADH-quinone oxidoreductase subunit C [Candidatus Dadabacteria bacterium]|nr:MAG: NADH-quinone oxidoreductase subunit C [Candidatus Dadabacteria bacterium]
MVVVRPETVADVLAFLKDDPAQAFDMLVDVTAVDFEARDGTLEVVYQLASLERKKRLMVKTKVPAGDPVVPSACRLWKAANWAEREVFDMFGVRFEGHPDLRRILMYPEFEGHPLRKSYPVDKRQPLVPERDPIADPWPSRDGR